MKIGGHVSIAGGIEKAPERAHAIGANMAQIFVSAPQGWRTFEFSDEQVAAFRDNAKTFGIDPIFVHALYLVNLATDDPALAQRSVTALRHALDQSARLGCAAVVFHSGSRKERKVADAIDHVVERITAILKQSDPRSVLAIENSAGEADGRKMGSTFEELGEIIQRVNSPRLKVCLDLQHAFAAGNDVRTPEGISGMLATFDAAVGLDRLIALHANDSKTELASHVDRHENIGKGNIGSDGFRNLLHNDHLRKLPWILEVPGDEATGPDVANVKRLQKLAE